MPEPQDHGMTLEYARSVCWLRQDPRPLGELLDEGSLTEKDLQWAAEYAYKPELKQAASVLLRALSERTPAQQNTPSSSTSPAIIAPLPLETARATIWPFSSLRGQSIGYLIDTNQLNLKDLGFAIDSARDIRVRRAAQTLMLHRLNHVIAEPPPEVGFLNVYSAGRSFAVGRQFQLTLIQGLIIGVVTGVLIALLIASIVDGLRPRDPVAIEQAIAGLQNTWEARPISIVLSVAILLGLTIGVTALVMFVVDQVDKRLERRIRLYRKGEQGETSVVEVMQQTLDGNWHLFRNLTLPGRDKADIDLILVGPSGVIAIEVKYWSGVYRNSGDKWERRTGAGWKAAGKSPSEQARRNAGALSSFLKADGISQWVEPVVIWSNPEAKLTVDNPGVAVWTLEQISAALGKVALKRPIDDQVLSQMIDKLTRLIEQQRRRVLGDEPNESN